MSVAQLPPPRPLLIAHRAGNDLNRLREAEDAGIDFVEADVWLHRGRLEVRHTKTLGRLPFLWDRWKLTPAWTPRLQLSALFQTMRPGTGVMLDLKGVAVDMPAMVMREIARDPDGSRPVLVCSQNWAHLEEFRDHPTVLAVHSVGTALQLRAVATRLTWHDHHVVSVHRRLLTPSAVAALKKRAAAVITWPVNDAPTLATLSEWGVDGVTSDSLELLRAVAAQRAACQRADAP